MSEQNEFMTDIETLDTVQGSVVLSVGFLEFDPDYNEVSHRLWLPSFLEQRKEHTISLDTIRFWADPSMGHTQASVDEAFAPENRRCSLRRFYSELAQYLEGKEHQNIWANGDIFDLGNITQLIRLSGQAELPPWKYNAPRDLRTLMAEAGRLGWVRPSMHLDHTALGDCRAQLMCLADVRKFLYNLGQSPL